MNSYERSLQKLKTILEAYKITFEPNENFQQALVRHKRAYQLIHNAYRDPNAPIGLKILSYLYLDEVENPKKELALGDILKVLKRDFSYFQLMEVAGILLPDAKEKDDIITDAEMEHKAKERDKYMLLGLVSGVEAAARGELDKYIKRVVKSRLIDEQRRRKNAAQKGVVYSLEELFNKDEGFSLLDLIESQSLQTQPERIDEGITQELRKQLKLLLGETGLKIFEYRYRHPEIAGQYGENKTIAQALGIAESTVGEYIGRKKRDGTKHVGVLEKKYEAIQKIM